MIFVGKCAKKYKSSLIAIIMGADGTGAVVCGFNTVNMPNTCVYTSDSIQLKRFILYICVNITHA